MSGQNDSFFEPFKERLEFDALKYQVGQAIFCPICEQVLDVHRAVGIDTFADKEAKQLKHTTVLCEACFEQFYPKDMVAEFRDAVHTVLHDGRLLDRSGHPFFADGVTLSWVLEKFQSKGLDGWHEHDGYPIELMLPRWTQPVKGWVYLLEKWKWYLVEASCGIAISQSVTMKGAIGRAWRDLSRVGEKKFRRAVEKALKVAA